MNERSYPGSLQTLRKRKSKKLAHRIRRRREARALDKSASKHYR